MLFATSREPPLVEWSLPPPSISTPCATHFAAQSTFQNSFAAPLHGAMRPVYPQGTHSSGERSQVYATVPSVPSEVEGSYSYARVVIIFPHFSHTTETGSHDTSFSEPEIFFKM